MKHYSAEQWQEFYSNTDRLENRLEMEKHLLECDECRTLFLKGINQGEIEKAALIIPPDFTSQTLKRAVGKMQEGPNRRKVYPSRRKLLACYATAAVITLVLMGGGVFQNLSGRINQLPEREIDGMSLRVNTFLSHWPDEVRASFWGQIDKLQWKNSKEVER
ncbi:MAG TPA: hypothetical protein VN426_01500 [Syntrophomonadaceae bacterium]|nr:hypothetical protein [Syntrophomonadaceae bacterium]